MTIKIRKHRDDPSTVEIFSIRGSQTIIWSTMHIDAIFELELTDEDLDNHEYKLEVKP